MKETIVICEISNFNVYEWIMNCTDKRAVHGLYQTELET